MLSKTRTVVNRPSALHIARISFALGTALMLLAAAVALLMVSCGGPLEDTTPPRPQLPSPSTDPSKTITLGDVEPEEPAKKVKRFSPLADFLADRLGGLGIDEGKVVIARDIEEMASFLRDGKVDLYFDSPFPALAVQDLSGSEIILRRWKSSDPVYWSTYVALRGVGIDSVDDFVGRVLAFEEPHSTSGFLLPAGTLVKQGFILRKVDSPDADVGPDEIGYVFTGDERNTFELLLQGKVAGGGVSNQDYEKLSLEMKEKVSAFGQTVSVPRQLVSARAGLGGELVEEVQRLLTSLHETSEGRELLDGLKETRRFDRVPAESHAALEELRTLMGLVPAD